MNPREASAAYNVREEVRSPHLHQEPTATLARIDTPRIDVGTKGFPAVEGPMPVGDIAGRGWTLSDLPTPVMVLREGALAHNLSLMAEYCRAWGVDIAPHGKTTMAPQLWDRQLQAGAWGITAATVDQARVMRSSGVARVLLANELVDPVSIAWVAEQLTDPAFELLCYVDSDRGVDILEEHLRARPPKRSLSVLVELGFDGGRTGCRTIPEAVHVAGRAASSDVLHLAGVAGYEGTICHDRSPECLALVLSYLDRLRELTRTLMDAGTFDGAERIVCSAGGSAFFDLVVDRLRGPWPGGADARMVLRSGCYLTHDSGIYERVSPLPARDGERGFHPAMELWGSVLSRPEPGLALLGFGKRDVPFDIDLPMPQMVRSSDGDTRLAEGLLTIVELNDQHAYARVDPGLSIDVGDRVRCGLSHPCTAFDKWRHIPVLDEDDRVIDAVATFF
jgi:D-serine deaminase-like pyridoxal phosphate-dependent protein